MDLCELEKNKTALNVDGAGLDIEKEFRQALMRLVEASEPKKYSVRAFDLKKLIPTIPCDPRDIDEYEMWKYKIGSDIIKIDFSLEDIMDENFSIYLNELLIYSYCTLFDDENAEYIDEPDEITNKIIDLMAGYGKRVRDLGKKVLFLDIMGVLTTMNYEKFKSGMNEDTKRSIYTFCYKQFGSYGRCYLSEACCKVLDRIADIARTVVITSPKRYDMKFMANFVCQLNRYVHVGFGSEITITPTLSADAEGKSLEEIRWLEINEYINRERIENYVIIDENDLSPHLTAEQRERFIKTNKEEGLITETGERCEGIFYKVVTDK